MTVQTSCVVCGTPFEARKTTARYCSAPCRRAKYAEKHLPPLKKALEYLGREIRRLENQLPMGTRRRKGRTP